MLIFPAEARNACLTRRFGNWHLYNLAADCAICASALLVGNVDDSGAGDGFDEAVAKGVEGSAERADVGTVRCVLLNLVCRKVATGADGPVVYKRAICNGDATVADGDIGISEISARVNIADTEFSDLADAAHGWSLVTFAAGLCVEERPQALGRGFNFGENSGVHAMRGAINKAVGLIIEAGGCFGGGDGC